MPDCDAWVFQVVDLGTDDVLAQGSEEEWEAVVERAAKSMRKIKWNTQSAGNRVDE
jgi:hypothetical protein